MGSSGSKAASKVPSAAAAATKSARKYPTRTPPTSTNAAKSKAIPQEKSKPVMSSQQQINEETDGGNTTSQTFESDPDLALSARLKSLGPVQPNPTQSNSSTFHSHSTSTSSFADPSLSASQFQPSKSNPMQTIFPSSSVTPQNPSSSSGSSAGSGSGNGYGLGSGSNPAVSLLTARYRLASEAENEFAQTGKSTAAAGRQFLDVFTLRQILVLRDEKGVQDGEIERQLGLKKGVVGRLGRRGVVGVGS